MLVRRLSDCAEFVAGDGCLIRELLHPDKAELALRYSLAHAKVGRGCATKPHRLATSEVYYVLEGTGAMYIDDETQTVGPGCAVYIPHEAVQFIENTGPNDLIFLCIVDPAWRQENEDVLTD
jgi:mannose-6-phosphate isomerase-like protein (cupin superfamily)